MTAAAMKETEGSAAFGGSRDRGCAAERASRPSTHLDGVDDGTHLPLHVAAEAGQRHRCPVLGLRGQREPGELLSGVVGVKGGAI